MLARILTGHTRVWADSDGGLYGEFCTVARAVVRHEAVPPRMLGCGASRCVCGYEGTGRLRRATREETTEFLADLDRCADAARYEIAFNL